MLADVSSTIMSSELRRHFAHTSFFKSFFHDVFPYIPVQSITECTRTDTLHSDPIWFFDGRCHKTQSKINGHPSIDRNSRRGHPLVNKIQYINVYCQLKYGLLIRKSLEAMR